jgi:kynurenine formamidase
MLIDITLEITPEMTKDAQDNEKKALSGHLGTHFDVMNKVFPLTYTTRKAIVFDVSMVKDRDMTLEDIDIKLIENDMFVAFCSEYIDREPYGTPAYFSEHPQLSDSLIDALLHRGISIIGIDFAGMRRGHEHTPKDQYCADQGVFVIENLCNLKALVGSKPYACFTANTYPLRWTGMTGLPCRVIAAL